MNTIEFDEYKKKITAYLSSFFDSQIKHSKKYALDRDILDSIFEFATKGKMYRGCILIYVYKILSGSQNLDNAIIAAAALELFESGVLIHDDVMDKDDMRRGGPSLRSYFRAFSPCKNNTTTVTDFGDNIAICSGIIAYFLAYKILYTIKSPPHISKKLLHEFSKEMYLLGLSQAEDIRLTTKEHNVTQQETIQMYIGKTARYTWILPIQIALILSGHKTKLGAQMEKVGTLAGIIYQLIDDTIGIFGDSKHTGKSTRGDISEGKKTLLWHYTRKGLSSEDLHTFDTLYGNKCISEEEIIQVKTLIQRSKAQVLIDKTIEKYSKEIERKIAQMSIETKKKELFLELLRFINKRTK